MSDGGTVGAGGGARADDEDRLTRQLVATLSEAQAAVPAASPDLVVAAHHRYAQARGRRVRLGAAACALIVAAATIGIGLALGRGNALSGPPAAGPRGETITVWVVRQPGRTGALQRQAREYGSAVELTVFGTEAEYRLALRAALGTPRAPDVVAVTGEGQLAELVRDGHLMSLGAALAGRPEAAGRFLPAALAGGRVGGGQYALPASGAQPVLLFYNKRVFADAGLRPPATYGALIRLVDEFEARGTTPLVLGGARGPAELPYLMYLLDRVAGPVPFENIRAGRPGAWTDPTVRLAAWMCQHLAQRGAFGDESVWTGQDAGDAARRLADGRAAMGLLSAGEYAGQLAARPSLLPEDELGWLPFPAVGDGEGDPANLVGFPGGYLAVSAHGADPPRAAGFLLDVLTSGAYLDDLARAGELPPVRDAGERLVAAPDPAFAAYTHRLVNAAPSFTASWDRALSPSGGARLAVWLRRLVLSEVSVDKFAAGMSGAR